MNSFEKLRWILPPVLVLTVLLMAFDQALFADRAFASDTSLSEAPQSVMQTEQNLDDGNVHRGSIEKVEFLNVDGLDKQTIDNVMASAEFQAQVEELRKSGSPLPAMSVLVALFVMGSLSLGGAAGSGRSYVNVPLGRKLTDFFRVDKVPRVVTKTIDVIKKVPVYTTRVVKETLSRVVKIPKQVAYTAYKTVREVSYKTREVVSNVMKYRPQSRMDKLSSMLRFIDRYTPETGHRTQRGIYSELRYLRREFEELRRMSGRKLRGRELYYYNRGLRQVEQAMGSISAKIVDHRGHGSPEYHRLRSIYLKDVERRYVDRVVNRVKEPVVKFVEKAYTAFRTEHDVKTETYVEERKVTDVSYKDVIEKKEIKETVFDKKISPLNEKIGLALNYVKNLKRIKTRPSNRSFKDALKTVSRTSPLANLAKVFSNLGTDVNNTRKGYAVNSTEARVSVGNYNKFVRDMKAFALNVRKSRDPYTAMFGSEYKRDVADREQMIGDYRARLDNLRMLKNELNAAWPAHGSGLHYARARSERLSDDMRKVNKSISRATKKLGDVRADYTRRFHNVLDQIDRLAYLKNTNTYVELLEKTNITFGIKHISPELAVNGSRPVFAGYSREAQALFAATGGETEEDTTFATAELGVRPPKTDESTATTTATQKQVAVPPKFKIAGLISPKLGGNRGPVFAGGGTFRQAGILDALKEIVTAKVTDLTATILPTGNGLRVRTEPSTKGGNKTVIKNLRTGEQLRIVGKQNGWFKVQLSDGTTGWISGDPEYVKVSAGAPITTATTKKEIGPVSTKGTNLTAKELKLILENTAFPMKDNIGDWTITYGSGAHNENGYSRKVVGDNVDQIWAYDHKYGLDINLAGNADVGKSVYPSYSGKIVGVDHRPAASGGYGFVVLEHEKKGVKWYTEYMHLDLNADLKKGSEVTKETVLGTIGRRGTDNDHLHYVVSVPGLASTQEATIRKSLNLSPWIDKHFKSSNIFNKHLKPA